MERKESEDVYAAIAELPMVYDDVHATTTDIPMGNIVSRDNICYDNPHAIPKFSVGANISTSGVTRDGRRDFNVILILIITVIILILSATCAGTVYTLVQLSRLKSEIASSNIASATSLEVSSASLEKIVNASLDFLHQQINDLAGTFNTSIQQIQIRENEKQPMTNDSLDFIHQQINDLAGTLNTSIQ